MANVLLIANLFETLSLTTGFPFGHYVHNPMMGPRIFLVPIAVSLGYFAGGYVAWAVAECLIGRPRSAKDRGWTFGMPVVASLILVGWDICQDPLGSTLHGGWTYTNPGGYFGVPLSNFLGWALVGWMMFQLFALILYFGGRDAAPSRGHGLQAATLWGAMALQLPLLMLTTGASTVRDASGWPWRSADILQAGTVTGLFLMLPVAIIAAIIVSRRDDRHAEQ